MTTGQELFVEMVRAKHRREDQTKEINFLKEVLRRIRDYVKTEEGTVSRATIVEIINIALDEEIKNKA